MVKEPIPLPMKKELPHVPASARLAPNILAVADLLARVYARELAQGGSQQECADNAARPTSAPPRRRPVNLSAVRTRARRARQTVQPAA